jgi:hypothetical protein
MAKRIRTPEAIQKTAKRKEDNLFYKFLGTVIRFEVEHVNFPVTGPIDHQFLDGLYYLLHNRVIKECAFPKDRFEKPLTPTQIPEELRTHLMAFLEDCAISKAAFYRRDWLGYVWEIIDENAYAQCCQKHGFSETDYQVVWLKEVYGESGERIKKDN